MKKLFLLLAGLAVMVSCTDPAKDPNPNPGPGPGPGPDPDPTAVPMINREKIEMKSSVDTVHLILQNGDLTKLMYSTPNKYYKFLFTPIEGNDSTLIVETKTPGEIDLVFTCGETEFPVSCKITPSVTEEPYTMPMLRPFGKTIDEVKAILLENGHEITFEGLSEDKKIHWVTSKLTTPHANTRAEEFEFAFPTSGLDFIPGVLSQSTHYAIYGNTDPDKAKVLEALTFAQEAYYYDGVMESGDEASIGRELDFYTIYRARVYKADYAAHPGSYLLISYFLPFTPEEEAPAIPTRLIPALDANSYSFVTSKPIMKSRSAQQTLQIL